jgi:hypothetical protein
VDAEDGGDCGAGLTTGHGLHRLLAAAFQLVSGSVRSAHTPWYSSRRLGALAGLESVVELGPIDFGLNDSPLLLWVVLAFVGLPIMVIGHCRMKYFQRLPAVRLVMPVVGLALLWMVGHAVTLLCVVYVIVVRK